MQNNVNFKMVQLTVTCKCNLDKSLKSDIFLRLDMLINALNFKFVLILLMFFMIHLNVFVSLSNFLMYMSVSMGLCFSEIFETHQEVYVCDLL